MPAFQQHETLSIWGLWVDQPHTHFLQPRSSGRTPAHTWPSAQGATQICRLGSPGRIPEDAGRCQDWLAPLSRWWHSRETAPRDG